VKAGNTGLPPGPAISEFRDLGVKTKIELGSIFIVSDTVVAKRGDKVTPKLASMLSKLGIKPLEVGLSLNAAYYKETILTEEQLHVDVDAIMENLATASKNAFNLTLAIAYPTKENIILLLRKANSEAKALALNSAYPTTETIHSILAIAHSHGVSLSQKVEKAPEKEAAREKT
jgi:large subunit ribosomal protein L10